jgi:hypothetical protein
VLDDIVGCAIGFDKGKGRREVAGCFPCSPGSDAPFFKKHVETAGNAGWLGGTHGHAEDADGCTRS